jgi:hypothetical protein
MLERFISEDDVLAVFKSASGCWLQTNGRWKLEGTDCDGESLFVLIELQEVVVVVNTFRGDEDEDEQG